MKSKNGELLTQVKEVTQSLSNWADVSNALFDPNVGLLVRAYPDPSDREEFMKTAEYKAIRGILTESIEKSGLVNGAEPSKSGRFVVRRRIVQASLCLRFYTSAGWTREEVRQMLREDQRLARVFPRYFDDRDQAGQGSFELDDGLPHDQCDYFAVYGALEPFAPEALALHEIV